MPGCSEIRFRNADITFFDQLAIEAINDHWYRRIDEELCDLASPWFIAPEGFVLPDPIHVAEVGMATKELVVYSGECHWKALERKGPNEFETHQIAFQALSSLLPKKKMVRVVMGALTRVEWSGLVEVPDDGTTLDEGDLLDKVYSAVDGGDYYDDEHFWDKGEQHVEEPDATEDIGKADYVLCEDGDLLATK